MTTSRDQRSLSETLARLEQENAQLRHAVDSHAVVDQAIGVLAALHRMAPAAGFEVLREVSQHTNIKLHTVAETLIAWALLSLTKPLDVAVGDQADGESEECFVDVVTSL
ncbi:ANTAR domain-containing protein, partial [Streptomyces rishiriensis]|uniref:ANTAR domain-containing protein n=1 Tax=Streptomyces rishiriensis TaxID=68264 RepID=UPI0037D93F11